MSRGRSICAAARTCLEGHTEGSPNRPTLNTESGRPSAKVEGLTEGSIPPERRSQFEWCAGAAEGGTSVGRKLPYAEPSGLALASYGRRMQTTHDCEGRLRLAGNVPVLRGQLRDGAQHSDCPREQEDRNDSAVSCHRTTRVDLDLGRGEGDHMNFNDPFVRATSRVVLTSLVLIMLANRRVCVGNRRRLVHDRRQGAGQRKARETLGSSCPSCPEGKDQSNGEHRRDPGQRSPADGDPDLLRTPAQPQQTPELVWHLSGDWGCCWCLGVAAAAYISIDPAAWGAGYSSAAMAWLMSRTGRRQCCEAPCSTWLTLFGLEGAQVMQPHDDKPHRVSRSDCAVRDP